MNWLTLLPISALVAIGVFLLKEAAEYFRRRAADKRKLHALMMVIARECEINYWTIKSLQRILRELPGDSSTPGQIQLSVETKPSGRPYAKIVSDDDGLETHIVIPEVSREFMSKHLVEVAALDADMFSVLEPAYDGLAEVAHVRESFVRMDDSSQLMPREDYLAGFRGYALDELDDAERALSKLYVFCTGRPLVNHRLR